MDQEVAVNRVLRDLKMLGLISEESNGEVKVFLNALVVVGIEIRSKEISKGTWKKVFQFDSKGNKIGEYVSAMEAARKTKSDRKVIERHSKTGKITRKGHYWSYTDF